MTFYLNKIKFIFLFILLIAFVSPILYIFLNIFSENTDTWLHIKEYLLDDYIFNSLVIVFFVGIITVILGSSLAWIVSMYEFPGSTIFKWLLILPLAVPTYVNAYIYAGLNETSGFLFNFFEYYFNLGSVVYDSYDIRNISGAIFIMSISLYPYVYLLCLPALSNHSYNVFEVGQSLGLSRFERLTRIGLPIIRPALIAGASLVVMETLAEYATVQYFGVPTFATGIFRSWFVLGDENSSFHLSSLLLTLIFLLVYFEQMSRGSRKFHNPTNNVNPMKREVLINKSMLLAVLYCFLVFSIGFLIPLIQILYWISYSLEGTDFNFLYTLLKSSSSLALLSSVIIIIFTLNIAYIVRNSKSFLTKASSKILSVGYAIPGVVLAVAIIAPITAIENYLPKLFNYDPRSIVTGTFILLVVGYLVRFSAISLKSFESGLNKISKNYDLLTSSFGYSKIQALYKVHLPILLPTIYSATILIFVDVVKELPITLILRPFNFNTLPVYLYELAEAENLSAIGMPGLILIIICLIPVIILSKGIMKNESK